ncbi:MAG: LysM peptidoglycan-binding domain-containing protein, partial [Bacilli bacterium]|nr:LysM peptidoglycan-binding domain-containing protein [Bacilli bacterium]
MKYHVVQVNETVHDVARKYQISVEEIMKLNRHITSPEYIIPGMKLRLPVLTEEVSEELKDNFLDIEKYY